MKVWVKRSCGHEEQIEVVGKTSEREYHIKREEEKVCKKCYEAEKYADYDEVEMSYREYKQNYNDCKTKANSYDVKNKTIIVYVPRTGTKTESAAEPETNSMEDRITSINKVAEETGLPVEAIKKMFLFSTSKDYLKMTEEAADKLKAAADKTGKYENAYIAAIELGKAAQKYNL